MTEEKEEGHEVEANPVWADVPAEELLWDAHGGERMKMSRWGDQGAGVERLRTPQPGSMLRL